VQGERDLESFARAMNLGQVDEKPVQSKQGMKVI